MAGMRQVLKIRNFFIIGSKTTPTLATLRATIDLEHVVFALLLLHSLLQQTCHLPCRAAFIYSKMSKQANRL